MGSSRKRSSALLLRSLSSSAVQDICNKNYMQICDSMDKIITMKRDMNDMSVLLRALR